MTTRRSTLVAAATLLAAAVPATATVKSPWRDAGSIGTAPVASPVLAVNGANSAVAVWTTQVGTQYALDARFRAFGGAWSDPVRILAPASVAAPGPTASAAIDGAGNVLIAWRRTDGSDEIVEAAVRPAATGVIGAPQRLTAPGVDAGTPQASIGSGVAVVAWSATIPFVTGSRIQGAARPVASGTFLPTAMVSPPATAVDGNVSTFRLSGAADGSALVAIPLSPFPGTGVMSAYRPAAGPAAAAEALPADAPQVPAVALGTSAQQYAVGADAAGQRVIAAVRPSGAPWPAFAPITPASTSTLEGPFLLQSDSTGGGTAAWTRVTGGNRQAMAAERLATGTWRDQAEVSPGTESALGLDLAVAGTGAAALGWLRASASLREVRVALRPAAGAAWASAEAVTTAVSVTGDPLVGATSDGGATALWVQDGALRGADRSPGTPGDVALTAEQLLINQRIDQAAINRANYITTMLNGGLRGPDLQNGALTRAILASGITTAGAENGAVVAPRTAETFMIPSAPREGGTVELSTDQILINQRISQEAVYRANLLTARLEAGLTGGDVVDGTVTATQLAPGLTVTAAAAGSPPPGTSGFTIPRPPREGDEVQLTEEQLLINQRISQAAIRRLNVLLDLLSSGVTAEQFQDGSITAADLAP